MDLETENRLAALLMEEARRLRSQAEKEGVHVYLQKPNVRGRPNSRFLTATVLGVEQANRAAEVGEMWRAREKELELDSKLKSRGRNGDKHRRQVNYSPRHDEDTGRCSASAYCSSSKRGRGNCYHSDNGGLRDEELEEFLHSRAKRGRGAIGSRMDEPGPYMSSTSLDHDDKFLAGPDMRVKEEWEGRILGPEKPPFLKKSCELSLEADDSETSQDVDAHNSKRSHSKEKKRSKEEKSERRKSKERKKSKHHHHHKSRRRRADDSE